MFKYSLLCEIAKKLNCEVYENEPMNKHTSFLIGGTADVFIVVKNTHALEEILKNINENKIPVFVLGKGSNILVSDNGIRGVVIKLNGEFSKIELLENDKIKCGAGVSLSKLCSFALKNSLSGLEFAWGIPGSCGGAAYMNAGAYCGEMKDVLISCDHLTASGTKKTFCGDDLDLSYRHSVYSNKDYIITSLVVKLKKDTYESIKSKMDNYINKRITKQPLEYPSAGSVFKRPCGYFAGCLIDQCGLKGKKINEAQVSDKHCGFIINRGKATCADVLNLIECIQHKVKEDTGILLECEIKKVGEFNK